MENVNDMSVLDLIALMTIIIYKLAARQNLGRIVYHTLPMSVESDSRLELVVPVSRARSSRGPVVTGSRTMQISNKTDAISKFVYITHECRHSKKLRM